MSEMTAASTKISNAAFTWYEWCPYTAASIPEKLKRRTEGPEIFPRETRNGRRIPNEKIPAALRVIRRIAWKEPGQQWTVVDPNAELLGVAPLSLEAPHVHEVPGECRGQDCQSHENGP